MADAAGDHTDRPVAACPGWTVADVVGHLGVVYGWAASVVAAGGARPESRRATPPDDRSRTVEWFRTQRDALISALSASDPDSPAWAFTQASPATVGWWCRRQALETTVHLFDVRSAAGLPPRLDPALASDGADEMLTELLPFFLGLRPVPGLSGTFHVHATDVPGEWSLDFDAPGLDVRREHSKAATAVRGPAAGLFLWLWNRVEADEAGLEVFGDPAVAGAWRELRI